MSCNNPNFPRDKATAAPKAASTSIPIHQMRDQTMSPSGQNDASWTAGESKTSPQQIADEDDEFGRFIIETLGPEVGREFLVTAREVLCYTPREPFTGPIEWLQGFTLLDALHLDITSVRPIRSAPRASDLSPDLSYSTSQLAGGGQGVEGGLFPRQHGPSESPSVDPNNTASTTKARKLRCPFNVLLPEYYCSSSKTDPPFKFNKCAGPGYMLIQHLKEHIKSTHIVSQKSSDCVPRCGRCQETFRTNKELGDHDREVDCELRCLECQKVFMSKSDRNAHNDEKHPKPTPYGRDIDQDQYDEMTSLVKNYNPSLDQKGKQPEDSKLEEWVKSNIDAFMMGRKVNVNYAQLQLGQWYIMFTTLFPRSAIPKHPFYDLEVLAPADDEIKEKFIFIFKTVRNARRKVAGPLPTDPDEADRVFDDMFCRTFRIITNTSVLTEAKGTSSSL